MQLTLSKWIPHPEGYRLTVNEQGIRIEGSTPQGVFYGLQTFRQLITTHQGQIRIPYVVIDDAPAFKWRSFMLDDGRAFKGMKEVKQLLDEMAILKMNTFHWHLTDDQGWRMEVKKYPKLTEVSKEFYTQEEIKDVISYAKQRFITVVPEIDLPGHTTAALVAYPQLGCTGGPYTMTTDKGGVHKDVLCMGKGFSYQFAKDVLAEVATLFPSPYIHIGGDEVPRDRWKQCPDCQAAIKKYHLKATKEQSAEDLLQGEFNVQMAAYLKTRMYSLMGTTSGVTETERTYNTVNVNGYTEMNYTCYAKTRKTTLSTTVVYGGSEKTISVSAIRYTGADQQYKTVTYNPTHSGGKGGSI